MKEYNITFSEALDLLLEGKWLRGHQFQAGLYIKLDYLGQLVLVDVNDFSRETPYTHIRALANNKYRVITVATVNDLKD